MHFDDVVSSYLSVWIPSKKYKKQLWDRKNYNKYTEIPAIREVADRLELLHNPKKTGRPHVYDADASRTVVVMPFLGGVMGSGHSELGNRFVYLKACFWSLYQVNGEQLFWRYCVFNLCDLFLL